DGAPAPSATRTATAPHARFTQPPADARSVHRPGRSRCEKPRCHYLAALDEPVLRRSVVGDGIVYRPDVFPHEHVSLLPARHVAEFRPELVCEQELERLGAFLFGQLVDPHRVAGIGVKHLAPGERMREKYRL